MLLTTSACIRRRFVPELDENRTPSPTCAIRATYARRSRSIPGEDPPPPHLLIATRHITSSGVYEKEEHECIDAGAGTIRWAENERKREKEKECTSEMTPTWQECHACHKVKRCCFEHRISSSAMSLLVSVSYCFNLIPSSPMMPARAAE